ncbi:MAG TPA: M50 family metallopeptidase [Caulobacteraceae bacterium]|jgi:regulator of sigma E protease|nr:M50 family metallopeptidase [Caulobacteraceae bacterium]
MVAFVENLIMWVAPMLAIITVIITVHELGHFFTARACGVAIERFSVGFGRALLSWKDRSGVEWRIAWAPIGGYVRFALDENVASVPDEEDLEAMRARIVALEGPGAELKYLPFKPLWQRALIVVAGPAANFVLAVALFALIFGTVGQMVTPNQVAEVQPGSAAAQAGFRPGDRIVSANDVAINDFGALTQYVALHDIAPIDFGVRRGPITLHIVATPRPVREKSDFGGSDVRGVLGIEATGRLVKLDPVTAVAHGAGETWNVLHGTAVYFGRLVSGHVNLNQLHGVVGMARVSKAITQRAIADAPNDPGFQVLSVVVNLIGFAALISVSIGFMNLLPLPVLDGGHLLFYAYEWIAQRPLGVRVQAAGYRVGLALLVGLMLFANLHDLPLTRVFHFFGSLFS